MALTAMGATRQVQAIDPMLNMRAYTWTIPSNWIFEGGVINGSSCMGAPLPVFRMMSPDGIAELKLLPRMDWTWQTGGIPNAPARPPGDCLPLKRMIPANEFLKYMVSMLGVTFVRDAPPPNAAEFQESLRKANAQAIPGMKVSGDAARFLVTYNINSIPVDEYLSVTVRCTENTRRFGVNQVLTSLYACSAWVQRARARQGQLEAMQGTYNAVGKSFAIDPQWNQKRTQMEIDKIHEQQRQGMEAIKQQGRQIAAASQARHEAFMQSQAMRQRQHEQFLSTMQRGTNMSMNRTQESMNSRSRAAGDWADYALDQQKRLDPRTGEITKDSSAYSYTWVNDAGKRMQTNDVNENPNGRGSGNWTLQQNVH
ncbi:MAG TPA: hypothetical protein VGL53_28675 [Bryobacteraceae bacterium]